MKRHGGFTLVWVLILLTLLSTVAAALMQSASTSARSARSIVAGSLREVQERNLLSYGGRLLEANAAALVGSLPSPDGMSAAGLAARLQSGVAGWCGRDPDGGGANRMRVYFTGQACGAALPAGVSAPQPRLISQGSGLWGLEAPFVLVAPTPGRAVVRRGTLYAQYGAAPASVYALLASGSLTLDETVRVRGDVHTDGRLTLRGAVEVDGAVSSSACTAVTPGCVGVRAVTLGDVSVPVMQVAPSPGRPRGFTGFLALGQAGETAGMSAPTVPGLRVTAQEVVLGVTASGEQVVRTCLNGACTEYLGTADGSLRDAAGAVVISAWSGAIGVTGAGDVTVRPVNPDAPSIARPVSVVSTSRVVVTGSLTYAQSTCAGETCSAAGVTDVFSVQAPEVRVTSATVRLHGTVIAPSVRLENVLTVYGSVVGVPSGGRLLIQADPRARQGIAAPGVPRLSARWRQARVGVNP
jgi:type II secretory pathway pseudopilin PulG